ncbi:imm11 family protein [Leptospira interrogans serovar Szwajizak]|uniref:imm11 family protein n=1 Tax=Leptospira interrogans TaxID=173 RepID=UPI003CE79BC0
MNLKQTQKHFVLLLETSWADSTPHQIDPEYRNFFRGSHVKLHEKLPQFVLRVEKQNQNTKEFSHCDLLEAAHGQLLMSLKLLETLINIDIKNLQLFDCQVTFEPTGQELPYKLVNIVGVAKALDLQKSNCTIDENGFVETFTTLRLNESAIKDLDLFRLFERLPLIIISDRVKQAIEQAGITGVRIINDTEWEPGML